MPFGGGSYSRTKSFADGGTLLPSDINNIEDDLGNKAQSLQTDVDAINTGGGLCPSGVLVPFAGGSAPTGWLLCDGSAVSRSTYADLFTAIGVAYGSGNGSTTFNVPDTRGRMLTGKGTHADVDTLADNDGLAVGSRKPKHQHSVTINNDSHGHTMPQVSGGSSILTHNNSGGHAIGYLQAFNDGIGEIGQISSVTESNSGAVSVSVGDSGGATDQPSYVVVNYIVKT